MHLPKLRRLQRPDMPGSALDLLSRLESSRRGSKQSDHVQARVLRLYILRCDIEPDHQERIFLEIRRRVRGVPRVNR